MSGSKLLVDLVDKLWDSFFSIRRYSVSEYKSILIQQFDYIPIALTNLRILLIQIIYSKLEPGINKVIWVWAIEIIEVV